MPGADGMAWAKKLAPREGILTGVSGGCDLRRRDADRREGGARLRHPRHAARHGRALPDHAALRAIPEDMDEEERALSHSTPGYQTRLMQRSEAHA